MNASLITVLITISSLLVVLNVIFSFYRLSDRYRNFSLLFMGLSQMLCSFYLDGPYLRLLCAIVGCFVLVVSAVRIVRKM